MQSQDESLRNQIALGWLMELVVVGIVFQFMIIESLLMDNNLMSLRVDPGSSLKWLVYFMGVYALVPIFIHLVHGLKTHFWRWVAVALAVLEFIFFLLHHLSHWQAGQRPDFTSHVLDLTLHLIGLWVIVNSVRWARFRPAATAGGA